MGCAWLGEWVGQMGWGHTHTDWRHLLECCGHICEAGGWVAGGWVGGWDRWVGGLWVAGWVAGTDGGGVGMFVKQVGCGLYWH